MTNNIFQLNDNAIDSDGVLLFAPGLYKLVICQASWCGHCTHAKPEFQIAADATEAAGSMIVFCTIDGSGGKNVTNSQKSLASRIGKLFDINGFPSYLLFDRSGKHVKDFKLTGRDSKSIAQSLRSYV